jgi:hypothetical protein
VKRQRRSSLDAINDAGFNPTLVELIELIDPISDSTA